MAEPNTNSRQSNSPEIPKFPGSFFAQRKGAAKGIPRQRWLLTALGLMAFHLSFLLARGEHGLWVPAVGVGLALTAWLGFWVLPLLALDAAVLGMILSRDGGILRILLDCLFLTGQIGIGWWAYHRLAGGAKRLDDPHSATVFLILVPGFIQGIFGVGQGLCWWGLEVEANDLSFLISKLWINKALGTMVLVPMLLVVVTPWLVHYRFLDPEPPRRIPGGSMPPDWTWGEIVETGGLALSNCIFAVVLVFTHPNFPAWPLWGIALLLVVWASLRQGLRGGAVVSGLGTMLALILATWMKETSFSFSPLQGNMLAQCCTALLVGASAGWIRASEARYRMVVGHIPVLLYSVRLPRGLKLAADHPTLRNPTLSNSDPDLATGPAIILQAEVTLVSPASQKIFGCDPEDLLGPYREWVDRIMPDDQELVRAAVTQLSLQKMPVTCEYRLSPGSWPKNQGENRQPMTENFRWVRDSLTPYYNSEGLLAGWEGVIEDITAQQRLALRLRRTSNMFQTLITNLPTGVYFVQGPMGQPILVNARARQLLGQREDLAAGIDYLAKVYRLHRPDGSPYPVHELPVAKALRQGTTSMANDIVIHHLDGRKIPLITWAAPVDLGGSGKPDAAVWVLEDMTALQQAESALRESEARLRTVFETMAEGIILQNQQGIILECNKAASNILGIPTEKLIGRAGLSPEQNCIREDGSLFSCDQHPDRMSLESGEPVRNVFLGFPVPRNPLSPECLAETRWILVNAMPMPGNGGSMVSARNVRLVTTFADITLLRQAQEEIRLAKEKYQNLVETLPLMVMLFDAEGQIQFLNSATERLTGYSALELKLPGFWLNLIREEDRGQFQTTLNRSRNGYHARVEFQYRARDGSNKIGLALAQPHEFGEGELKAEDSGKLTNLPSPLSSPKGSTLLILDMTLQRRLENDLQRAQQLELVGRLASGTVHDFNNLLAAMMAQAYFLQNSLDPDHPGREYLIRLLEGGEQAAHLAGQILAFSKQRRTDGQEVNLNAVVLQSLKLLHGIMPHDIQVETFLASENLRVQGDETQLKQVVMNLCLNARDAMPQGGKLTIRTEAMEPQEKEQEKLQSTPPTGMNGRSFARLTVQDNGQGMEESIQGRIFEPFFSTKERGTGLGLAVVRQIVESVGGRVQVWSKPQQGTRMEVWLPSVQNNGA